MISVKIFCWITVFFFQLCGYVFSQTTISFYPDTNTFDDVFITSYYPNQGFPATDEIMSEAWTCGGTPCNLRSLIRFDLSSLPVNTVVMDAQLSFFAHPNQVNGSAALGPTYGSANQSYLSKVTSLWNSQSVSWNNQPSISTTQRVILPNSTSNYQDYVVTVTNLVQDMVSNPQQNWGFMLSLINETYYNCLIFCSNEFADTAKRPVLTVTFGNPSINCITLFTDSTTGIDAPVNDLYPSTNYGLSSTELVSAAWTCNSVSCNVRSLFMFDLSSLPTNTIVTSATLSLYAHPNQISGSASLGPTYGLANTSEINLITSPWAENTVTWNTQPSTSVTHQLILPLSTSNFQDYTNIDMTNMVQFWINNPAVNYGALLKLQNETYYNCMIFCSSDFPDSTKRPTLEICYSTNVSIPNFNFKPVEVSIFPNPHHQLGTISFRLNQSSLFSYTITDVCGKILYKSLTGNLNAGNHTIDLSNNSFKPPSGIYNVTININGNFANKKIVITH